MNIQKSVQKNCSQAALGLHFGGFGGAKSPFKPQPNGLRWVPEGHGPALVASGSQSRLPEAGKTRPEAAKGPVCPEKPGRTQK